MVVKHRSKLERRVYCARKINARKRVAKNIPRFDWLLEKERFADSLWYRPHPRSNIWWHKIPSRADLRNKERFNNLMEDYYYENVPESEEV